MGNREHGAAFARQVGQYLAHQGILVKPEFSVEVGLNSRHKKAHRFDYGSTSVLVECKFYDWTVSDNNPSAKLSTLNEAMMLFYAAPSAYRKMLFIAKTAKKGVREPATLAEYYVRLFKPFIPDDVEIWELDTASLTASRIPT